MDLPSKLLLIDVGIYFLNTILFLCIGFVLYRTEALHLKIDKLLENK